MLLAALSALAFAVASTSQQRVAASVGSEGESSGAFIRRLGTDPLWVMGTAFDLIAVVLQALALREGQLSVVQTILTIGLVFALALGARLDGRWLRPREWVGAVAIAGGISLFLLATEPSGGGSESSSARWATTLTVAVALAAVLAGRARVVHPQRRAAALALATGTLFGVVAALTKSLLHIWSVRGIAHVAMSWQLPVLAVVGLVGLNLSQRAFQAAPLSASLPSLTIADPLVGTAIGVGLFRERLELGSWHAPVGVLALTAMFAGAVALSGKMPSGPGPTPVVTPPG